MVKAGVVLVARIAPLFYFAVVLNPGLSAASIQPFFLTVAWIGAFTAVLAASQALVGFELKKILAYSTMSQIGYMMMAIGLAGFATDFAQGLAAGLYHLMSHAIFKACLFLAAGALIHAADSKYINDMGGMRDRMKITFAAFLIAAASLSGIPPFSGFWSKDAVLGTAWGAGQYGLFVVGALTAGLTAFYSFRMLGMVFFGGRSEHLAKVEELGHHVHEPSPVMWVPYTILAGATVLIGFTALAGVVVPSLNIEASLESAATGYMQYLFPTVAPPVTAAAVNVPSSLLTTLLVAIGFLAATVFYLARRADPFRYTGTGFGRSIYTFLEKRWYINAVYYKVFVNAPLKATAWLSDVFDRRGLFRVNDAGSVLGVYLSTAGNWVDVHIVDGAANGFASAGQGVSRALRRIQTGIVEQYVQVFALGIIVIIVLFLLAYGVKI
jgi:NADH-quinone oxidoreductase subunit L